VVRRIEAERVVMQHPDPDRRPVQVALPRLLAVRPDGQGRHYQFQGYAARRYATCAYVWSVSEAQAVLCVPEWHPRRAVRLPLRLLPADGRRQGAWLQLRCDLSASSAGRLQVADLATAPAPPVDSISSPALDAPSNRR
jgi:hypothetical protein